jgi:hypothetical protein
MGLTKSELFENARSYIANGFVPLVIYPVGTSYVNDKGKTVKQDKSPVGAKYGSITIDSAYDEFVSRYNKYKYRHSDTEPWIGILTGKNSGITVVDVDIKDDGMKTWKELKKQFGNVCACVQRSRSGGKHYLFKYDDKFLTASKYGGVGIDIRNDLNGCIVVEPSGNDEGSYKWITSPIDNELTDMPEWLNTWLVEHPAGDGVKKKPNVVKQELNKDILSELFNFLNVERFGNRENWIRLAFLCKSLDRRDIFYSLSEKAPKFTGFDDCDTVYDSAKDDCKDPITLKSLWFWLREDIGNEKTEQLKRNYANTVIEAVSINEKTNIDKLDIEECRTLCKNGESGMTDIMKLMYKSRIVGVGKKYGIYT